MKKLLKYLTVDVSTCLTSKLLLPSLPREGLCVSRRSGLLFQASSLQESMGEMAGSVE
jgi:hypothetical protein